MNFYMMVASYSGLRKVQRRNDSQDQELASLRRELNELHEKHMNMQLVNRAFLEVIAERIGLEQDKVEERLQEIIAEESAVKSCPQCDRPLPKSGKACLYCGTPPS